MARFLFIDSHRVTNFPKVEIPVTEIVADDPLEAMRKLGAKDPVIVNWQSANVVWVMDKAGGQDDQGYLCEIEEIPVSSHTTRWDAARLLPRCADATVK